MWSSTPRNRVHIASATAPNYVRPRPQPRAPSGRPRRSRRGSRGGNDLFSVLRTLFGRWANFGRCTPRRGRRSGRASLEERRRRPSSAAPCFPSRFCRRFSAYWFTRLLIDLWSSGVTLFTSNCAILRESCVVLGLTYFFTFFICMCITSFSSSFYLNSFQYFLLITVNGL